jgi:hypothetical protein
MIAANNPFTISLGVGDVNQVTLRLSGTFDHAAAADKADTSVEDQEDYYRSPECDAAVVDGV